MSSGIWLHLFQTVAFITVCCLSLVQGQFFGDYRSLPGFGAGLDAPLQAARDPRQNPGPVVFPPAPPDNGETSGVVVGASGYGFVPPNTSKTLDHINNHSTICLLYWCP